MERPINNTRGEWLVDVRYKNTLIITIGESWTYGDSLDPNLRRSQIYGRLIADSLNADFINIANCGYSNSWMLNRAEELLNYVNFSLYKKVFIIFTFTEAGRDFNISDEWLIDYTTFYTDYSKTLSPAFYDQVILDTERAWIKKLDEFAVKLPDNVTVVLGQNFPWHDELYQFNYTGNIVKLKHNWLDAISIDLGLETPPRGQLVTGWIFTYFDAINHILDIKDQSVYKEWCIEKLNESIAINCWLDNSPVNGEIDSKHPNPQGHQIWANYILSYFD